MHPLIFPINGSPSTEGPQKHNTTTQQQAPETGTGTGTGAGRHTAVVQPYSAFVAALSWFDCAGGPWRPAGGSHGGPRCLKSPQGALPGSPPCCCRTSAPRPPYPSPAAAASGNLCRLATAAAANTVRIVWIARKTSEAYQKWKTCLPAEVG